MRKIYITVFFCLGFVINSKSQTVSSNCSEVTVTYIGPNMINNLWGQDVGFMGGISSSCNQTLVAGQTGNFSSWKPRVKLLKKSGNNWILVSTLFGTSPSFTGLSSGTYKISVECAVKMSTTNCTSVTALNTLGQVIGFLGKWSGVVTFSNEVVVGKPSIADNQYSFVDLSGTNNNTSGFDADENVYISTSGLINYNSYFMAITELGGQQRWMTSNWVNSTLPTGNFNITNFWKSVYSAGFSTLQSYKFQLVTSNFNCSTWNVNEQSFFICPSGSGCKRSDFTINNVISLSTKPNGFIINNLDFSTSNNYDILIHSIDGKLISKLTNITNNNITLNNVINGMYIVTTYNNRKKIHTDKLLINN